SIAASDLPGDEQPDEDQTEVDPSEAALIEGKHVDTDVHEPRAQYVAAPNEERIHGLLGLVLLLARQGQKEGISDRVVQGVVDRILRCLHPPDDPKNRNESQEQVAR